MHLWTTLVSERALRGESGLCGALEAASFVALQDASRFAATVNAALAHQAHSSGYRHLVIPHNRESKFAARHRALRNQHQPPLI